MNYIIGCGGVGSAIVPSFCLLRDPSEVTLIDGDKLEKKNLNRQMFDASNIGQNKAQALGQKYGCQFVPEWYAKGKVRHYRHDCGIKSCRSFGGRIKSTPANVRSGSTSM